jgi:hypothetical protein
LETSAVAQAPLPNTARQTDTQILPIKSPTSTSDLLINIGYLVRHNLLVQRSLYSERALQHIFGSAVIKFRPEIDSRIFIDLLGLDHLVNPVLVNGIPLSSLSISLSWAGEKARATARLSVLFRSSPGLNFEDVIRVFGGDWKKPTPVPSSPHRIYHAPSRPHGNDHIFYDFAIGRVRQQVHFEFSSDASIESIFITAEGPEKG